MRCSVVTCATVAALLTAVGCSGTQSAGDQVIGGGTGDPLKLTWTTAAGNHVEISEAVAKHDVLHPFSKPVLAGGIRRFGLARVTATGGLASQISPIGYHQQLAWVGIFEIDQNAPHSCPPTAPSPSSLPPVRPHYYFAVLVNAATGAVSTWNEDMSGLMLRQCGAK